MRYLFLVSDIILGGKKNFFRPKSILFLEPLTGIEAIYFKCRTMPKNNKPSNLEDKPQERIKIRLPGFEFTSSSLTTKTIIVLVIILLFWLALMIILPKSIVIKCLTG